MEHDIVFERLTGDIVLTSDLHFHHRKLCTSYPDHFDVTRGYDTVETMNEEQIGMWNRRVHAGTTVIFLGDFMLGGPSNVNTALEDVWSRMNKPARFIWIVGNHDHRIVKSNTVIPAEFHKEYAFEHNDTVYACQHKPFSVDNPMGGTSPEALVHWDLFLEEVAKDKRVCLVHGHTHSTNRYSYSDMDSYPIQNCVCIDAYSRMTELKDLKINGVRNG